MKKKADALLESLLWSRRQMLVKLIAKKNGDNHDILADFYEKELNRVIKMQEDLKEDNKE